MGAGEGGGRGWPAGVAEAMRRALVAARGASGRTHPNPSVGAAVFRGDRVLATGATRPPGGPHAEVVALRRALRRHGARAVRGADMAVTLEPCCFTGRTPPCTDAILAAGIARVWIGVRDPDARVHGRGVRLLRRGGVRTELGVLADACREQHRGFLSVWERGRPFVALKLAATLDGRIATAAGESRWITGEAARRAVQALRARSDAILVGRETALRDDPELVARRGARVVRRPVRVVLDSRLRLPASARMLAGPDPERTWVLARRDAPARRRTRLEAAGARVLAVAAGPGGLDPRRALEALAAQGVGEVLVEGGGAVAAALLGAGLVDEVHWFTAPSVLGGDAAPSVGALGLRRLAERIDLVEPSVRRLGPDLYIRGRVRALDPRGTRATRRMRGGRAP